MTSFRTDFWGGPKDGMVRSQESSPQGEMYFVSESNESQADLYLLESVVGDCYRYTYSGVIDIP
jgi:hypothetical protein